MCLLGSARTLANVQLRMLDSWSNVCGSLTRNEYLIPRVFEMAVTVHLLHSPALDSYAIFWSLYQSLRPSSPSDKVCTNVLGYVCLIAIMNTMNS